MNKILRILAVALAVVAAAFAFHFIGQVLYQDVLDPRTVCMVVYALAIPAILVTLKVNYTRGGLPWWATALLALWFAWNWLVFITSGGEDAELPNTIMWAFIEPLAILVLLETGAHLRTGIRLRALCGCL